MIANVVFISRKATCVAGFRDVSSDVFLGISVSSASLWRLRLGKNEFCSFLRPTFRIFDVVCICLIDYEQIMKDAHEIS